MRSLSGLRYYLTSIRTLLTGFSHPAKIIAVFMARPGALPTEVQLRTNGWRFKVRSAMDVWIIKETCLDNDYVAPATLEPDWRIVDIGAGLGDFTIYAAKNCPDGYILAYEPLDNSFRLLQENLVLNKVTNATAYPFAVASRQMTVTADPTVKVAVSTRFIEVKDEANAVRTRDLGEILDALPGGECDFMKIDCEGCEFDLLLNSSPADLSRIHRISMECHDGVAGHQSAKLIDFLRQNGYQIQQRPNPVYDYLSLLYAVQTSVDNR